MIVLPPNLGPLARLTGASSRYKTDTIHVLDPGDGTYRLEATDGKVLCIVQGETRADDHPAIWEDDGSPHDYLMPAEAWKDAFQAASKVKQVGINSIGQGVGLGLDATGPTIVVAANDSVRKVVPAEGKYPPVDTVLPPCAAPLSVRCDPAILARLCDALARMGCETVDLLFWQPSSPIGLVGKTEFQYVDALYMPPVTQNG